MSEPQMVEAVGVWKAPGQISRHRATRGQCATQKKPRCHSHPGDLIEEMPFLIVCLQVEEDDCLEKFLEMLTDDWRRWVDNFEATIRTE